MSVSLVNISMCMPGIHMCMSGIHECMSGVQEWMSGIHKCMSGVCMSSLKFMYFSGQDLSRRSWEVESLGNNRKY